MKQTNVPEFKRVILNFTNKVCPMDEIPVYIYKQGVEPIAIIICLFSNKSIYDGVFPYTFEISRIVAVYKNGGNASKINFRPNSILLFFSIFF